MGPRHRKTADVVKGKLLTMGVYLKDGVWQGICLPLFNVQPLGEVQTFDQALEALFKLVCRQLEELCMEAETLCKRSINAKSS